MSRPQLKQDVRRVFDVLKSGGIAIYPIDIGYAMAAGSKENLKKIHATKQRKPHKMNAMPGNADTARDIQILGAREHEMIAALTEDYDLPVGVIAPFRPDHPLMRKIDPEIMAGSAVDGTVAMLLNAGPFQDELCRLSLEHLVPILGSSANLTGTGVKYRIEDIQPPMRAIADIEINYGLRKYHHYGLSSTMIDFRTMDVVRIGSCYDLISDALKRDFGVELPPDPGRARLPNGNLRELRLGIIKEQQGAVA